MAQKQTSKPKTTARQATGRDTAARGDLTGREMTDPGMTGLGQRIKKAREGAGFTQTSLGIAFGLTRSAVSQWESGLTEPTPANLRQIAISCRVDYNWLATGRGDGMHLESEAVLQDGPQERTVPVVGYVSAGAETKFIPLPVDELDRVQAPPGSTEKTQCLQVRGTSLGEIFDRWLVFYDDVRSPITSDLIGKLCIVGLTDERVVVKKIKRENGEYILLSNTEPPMRGIVIVWAAKVTDMRPQ